MRNSNQFVLCIEGAQIIPGNTLAASLAFCTKAHCTIHSRFDVLAFDSSSDDTLRCFSLIASIDHIQVINHFLFNKFFRSQEILSYVFLSWILPQIPKHGGAVTNWMLSSLCYKFYPKTIKSSNPNTSNYHLIPETGYLPHLNHCLWTRKIFMNCFIMGFMLSQTQE